MDRREAVAQGIAIALLNLTDPKGLRIFMPPLPPGALLPLADAVLDMAGASGVEAILEAASRPRGIELPAGAQEMWR